MSKGMHSRNEFKIETIKQVVERGFSVYPRSASELAILRAF